MLLRRFSSVYLIMTACWLASCSEPTPPISTQVEQPAAPVTSLRTIEPTLGETPDISTDARNNYARQKQLFHTIDSAVQSYPDYETAKRHLTQRQLAIYEDEETYSREDHLDVSIWGCSWYCDGGPEDITASSVLPPSNNLNYQASNAHDFSLRTAWVEGTPGLGIGETITYRFAKGSPPVTTVQLYNGYMKSAETWQDNARVKQLKLYVNDTPFALLNVQDTKAKQLFAVDTLQGKKEDLILKFEITAVYKGDRYEDVAISEIEFDGIGVHCFGEGTLVATPDGERPIEKLAVGSTVLTYNETTRQTEPATIVAVASQPHHNLYKLNFSGTTITATDDHPFYRAGQFYSVKKNDLYGIQTRPLQVGQNIAFLTGNGLVEKPLTTLKATTRNEMTYTITKLSRNRLFFANGACVAIEAVQ